MDNRKNLRKGFVLAAVAVASCWWWPTAGAVDAAKSAKRLALIAPVKDGELRLRPTFTSCGVCWGAKEEQPGLRLEWRTRGSSAWSVVREFPRFAESGDYRASILNLAEDTDYEVRVASAEGAARDNRVPRSRKIPTGPAGS